MTTPRCTVRFDGHRLRELRQRRGLSVEDLAVASGVTARHIWRLEAGQRTRASAATLACLATVLNTSIEYLVGLTDEARSVDDLVVAFIGDVGRAGSDSG